MPTFSSALLPTTNGLTFGSAALRWTAYIQDIDIAGVSTITGRFGVKNLEDIRFADQYTGTVTQQLDGAITDVVTGLVVAPSTMGAGSPTTINSAQYLLDLRNGVFKLYCGNTSTPQLNVTSGGVAAQVFTGSNANPAAAGLLRLAKIDALNFRNNANGADINGLSLDASDVVQVGGANGAKTIGALAISGALTGATSITYSGQIISTLGPSASPPIVVSNPAVCTNVNVAILNGVTVSGAPTTGQALVATGTTTASWSSNSSTFKSESVQYTPVTKTNTGANQTYMSFALGANELAVGQAIRIFGSGTYTDGTGGGTWTGILKAGATTLVTSPAITTAIGTSRRWSIEYMLICTAAGSGGTLEAQVAFMQFDNITASAAGNTVTVAFDTTTSQTLNFTATMSAGVGISTTQRQMVIERIG